MNNFLCSCFNNKQNKKEEEEKYEVITFEEDCSELQLFDFNSYETYVKIVDIYDGDTFTGCFKYNNKLMKYKFRCLGYDSPEMKPLKSIENREEHIKKAHEDKEFFSKLVMYNNGICDVELLHFDKYGRILGTVYNNDKLDINEEMIKLGHGYPYDGGTKRSI